MRGRARIAMKTFQPDIKSIQKKWRLIDAKGKVLGKVAAEAAKILRGKHKVEFTPHLDCGDEVIIINIKDIVVTGKKMEQKIYTSYSGYPGGLKKKPWEVLMQRDPAKIMIHAVKGMLPHNRLGRKLLKKLRVYADDKHPHSAQKAETYNFQ